MKPKVVGLLAVACALLATAASRAGSIAGELDTTGAAPEAALDGATAPPRSALDSVPLSLGAAGDPELLAVRLAAIFGGAVSITNFAEEALGPASQAARVLGTSVVPEGALQPVPPVHAGTEARSAALRPSPVALRGEIEGLLPLGAGLVGIGVLGRRPSARGRAAGNRRFSS